MKTEQLPPSWILIAVLTLIFGVAEGLMYSLDHFFAQTMSRQARALINAGALTLIMSPIIWWLVMRRRKPALTSEAATAKRVADAAADVIVTMDVQSSVEPFNPAAVKKSGYEAKDAAGNSLAMPMNEPQSGGSGVLVDIARRKAAEERIRRMTNYDSVSGLADRQQLYHCLGEDIATAIHDHKEVVLVYLSLATFKDANPALGRHAADQVLATVGERIRYQARRSDMVAKMGGDEFAVVMSNGASRQSAVDVSERIVSALAKPYYLDGQKQAVQIGIRIGIAIFPVDAQDADNLFKAAFAETEKAK